ncbi:MAG: hypothetical protein MUF47_03265, partial [Porphyrobacter sp.]|nr:hypothetical protein [Porphyrobacter sp.]
MAGEGGIGFVGSNVTIVNSGTIQGGMSGDGSTRALAMRLSGNNRIFPVGTVVGGIEIASGITTFDLTGFQNFVTIRNAISGAGGIALEGTRELVLSGDNTYTGVTLVNSGALVVDSNQALGTTDGGTIVANGATLGLIAGVTSLSEPLTLSGSGFFGIGALLQ